MVALPVKVIGAVAVPLHNTCALIGPSVGTGNTSIVNSSGIPEQVRPALVNCGVTLTLALPTEGKLFCVTKELMLPVPELAKPMVLFELDQIKLFAFPEKSTAGELLCAQSIWSATGVIVGVGFTVIEKS